MYDDHKKINHVPIDEMIMKLEQGLNHLKSIKGKAELVTIERTEDREMYFIDTIDNCMSYEIKVRKK
ncbi:hypothetical protein KFV05_05075 [Macrococcoides canis]|uniref:hypothetical protein n=1 Tax=Macrococcoides canis TaxID=1855823 RepID=UPI0020B822B3|nr:hypothetical protein [Macrococcus canis]UTH03361.1 hypothetical protein KFV05_05075 [Macrococcus canis]